MTAATRLRPAIRTVAVVVPAADEQDHLEGTLAAIRTAAAGAERRGVVVRVVVVLDACTDGSAAIVAAAPGVEAVVAAVRRVGAARAIGCRHLLASVDPETTWLANTDADSLVPADWLEHMLDAASVGVDVVLGTVTPLLPDDPELHGRWTEQHTAVDGHAHVHGANFGIRASTYAAAGGWAALSTGEDVDLAARAGAVPGALVLCSARTPVGTSGRRVGRAPEGFAGYLRDLEAGAALTAVVSPVA